MHPQNPVGHGTLCSHLVKWHADGNIRTLALEHLTDPQASERTPQKNTAVRSQGAAQHRSRQPHLEHGGSTTKQAT